MKKRPLSPSRKAALETRKKVKRLLAQGMSLTEVGYQTGITSQRVGQIKKELEAKGEL